VSKFQPYTKLCFKYSKKDKVIPLQWSLGFWQVKAAEYLDTRRMKVVRSSSLRTGRLYLQEYPGTHF